MDDNNALSIQFPPEATARIDAMAKYYDCEAHDIIGRALALMELYYIKDAQKKTFAVLNEQGEVEEQIKM